MTPSYFYKEITSEVDAKRFICELYFDGKMFHFASEPEEIYNIEDDTPAFNKPECDLLRARVAEVFEYIEDPYQLCLALVTEKQ
jgi:hypothetical protein